jgi:hypothetical protein
MAEDTPVKAVQVKLVLLGAFSVWIRATLVRADVPPFLHICPSYHVPHSLHDTYQSLTITINRRGSCRKVVTGFKIRIGECRGHVLRCQD